MSLHVTLFQSKVARRMFILFVVSALIPVALLAYLTVNQVTRQLSKQTQQHLHQNTKAIGQDIFQMLSQTSQEMDRLTRQFALEPNQTSFLQNLVRDTRYNKYFMGLGVASRGGTVTTIVGKNLAPYRLTENQQRHIKSGLPVISISTDEYGRPRFMMIKALHPTDKNSGLLIAEINPENLWSLEQSLPVAGEFCIFGNNHAPLFCSVDSSDSTALRNKLLIVNPSLPQFVWQNHDKEYAAYFWPVFLDGAFAAGEWTAVLSIPSYNIYQPLDEFRGIFLPIVALSILLVAYISSNQIRKSLTPLEKLKNGTERLSQGNFQTHVSIKSGDEFEDLALSFNKMADRLNKQFTSLQIMSEVDRIMLSSLDANYIVETVMERIKAIAYCQRTLIYKIKTKDHVENTIFDSHHLDKTQSFFRSSISINEMDQQILEAHPRYLFSHADTNPPSYIAPLILEGGKSFIVFPIFLREHLFAVLILEYKSKIDFEEYDFQHARELADRIAVALTSADWEEKVYRQANYDVLTDLPNRNLLTDRLDQSIQRARRDGTQVAILLVDLDRFKAINDSLGHNAGDTLLRKVSDRLKKVINSTDTLVRFGSDEFVVIMSDIKYHNNSVTNISHMAELLLDAIMKPYDIGEHEINISASIGISLYPSDSRNVNDLLKFAESSMYHSKSIKKGHYQFYSSEINATSISQLVLENDLRHAIARNQLELYFQPQLDLKTGEIVCAEALLRWHHPESGLLLPDKFLPLAENVGLNIPLGDWVIEQVCRQIKTWGDTNKPFTKVAINLSAHQFGTEDLPDNIKFQLDRYNLDVNYLEVEITEDTVMADINKATRTLQQLNQLGTELAIDDFGTGYSSLSYLTKFPIHYLKIDQSFVKHVPKDKSFNSVISATIAMAHSLNLKVIAEGVETIEQLDFLKSLHCDIVQGYFVSKPLTASDYAQLLMDRNTRHATSSL